MGLLKKLTDIRVLVYLEFGLLNLQDILHRPNPLNLVLRNLILLGLFLYPSCRYLIPRLIHPRHTLNILLNCGKGPNFNRVQPQLELLHWFAQFIHIHHKPRFLLFLWLQRGSFQGIYNVSLVYVVVVDQLSSVDDAYFFWSCNNFQHLFFIRGFMKSSLILISLI